MLPCLCTPQLDRMDLVFVWRAGTANPPPNMSLRTFREARKCTILRPYKDIESIAPVPFTYCFYSISVLCLALIEFLTLALKSANNCHFLVDSLFQSFLPTT